jgi:uncharacterized damage-inducible protein DinB
MKSLGFSVVALALTLIANAPRAFGQAAQFATRSLGVGALAPTSNGSTLRGVLIPGDQSATGASFNARQAAVAELQEAQQELVSLAQAMPADKYTWRPAEGVRSVAEVYLHVCAGNFGLTALAGAPPKPGFKFQGYEKSTTDKAQIIDRLIQSFAFAENGISSLSDADLSKPTGWHGYPGYPTVGDLILHIVAHAHEHLGQSIAYARMNGIVPPWTAALQQNQSSPPARRD